MCYDADTMFRVKLFGLIIIITTTEPFDRPQAVKLNGRIGTAINRDDKFPKEDKMDFDLHDGKKVLYRPSPTDAEGNPAPIESSTLSAVSDNTTLVTIDPAPTDDAGNIIPDAVAIVSAPGRGTGGATVTVTADADLGEGVKTITETLNVNVIAGDADALGGSVGAEVDRDSPFPA